MFYWYKNAQVCYAYLEDVEASGFPKSLPTSRWFTRGWTLQELIAPESVISLDKNFKEFGTNHSCLLQSRRLLAYKKMFYTTKTKWERVSHNGCLRRRNDRQPESKIWPTVFSGYSMFTCRFCTERGRMHSGGCRKKSSKSQTISQSSLGNMKTTDCKTGPTVSLKAPGILFLQVKSSQLLPSSKL
jgi:hypothetical protein